LEGKDRGKKSGFRLHLLFLSHQYLLFPHSRSKRFLSAGGNDAAVRIREVKRQESLEGGSDSGKGEETATAVVVPVQQQQPQQRGDDGLHLTYAEVGMGGDI
jgi:hypothetical protein